MRAAMAGVGRRLLRSCEAGADGVVFWVVTAAGVCALFV